MNDFCRAYVLMGNMNGPKWISYNFIPEMKKHIKYLIKQPRSQEIYSHLACFYHLVISTVLYNQPFLNCIEFQNDVKRQIKDLKFFFFFYQLAPYGKR